MNLNAKSKAQRAKAAILALCTLLLAPCALLAVDASTFGFDAGASDNYGAMRTMETYAATNGSLDVTFTNGTYNVILPTSGSTNYRGAYQGACDFTNITGITIDAASAEFYCTNLSSEGFSMFRFYNCTNVSVTAQFRGEHSPGDVRDGVKAVHLLGGNKIVTLNLTTTRLFEATRLSEYLWSGVNRNVTITATNVDSYYGVAAYLGQNLTITNYSIGTSSNGFAAHRSIYLAGVSNVTARGYFKDLAVADGCNLITSTPTTNAPFHWGSTNVSLHATDMGSTHVVGIGQSCIKVGVVTSDYVLTNIVHQGLQLDVVAPSSDIIRTDNFTIAFGSLGDTAAHQFKDIRISGTAGRGPYATHAPVNVDSTEAGLALLEFDLRRFHDAVAPAEYTIMCLTTNPVIHSTAQNSTVNLVVFAAPSYQTFTNLGNTIDFTSTTTYITNLVITGP